MPSQLFQQLALSQLELLATSLTTPDDSSQESSSTRISKIKSMALYLPQENPSTGALEFSPAVRYPHPSSERVFIANEAESGVAPKLPRTLTTLPGFAHATSLIPGYPLLSTSSSTEAGVGVVEEVLCDVRSGGGTALSVPLVAGSRTVGVLLVSPIDHMPPASVDTKSVWSTQDREQVARAAKSLSLALSMDTERTALQLQNQQVQTDLSDNLHQLKNPLQALRTFGKLYSSGLQMRMRNRKDLHRR
jgi:signal transduction histidine kinase